jgi:HAD superfamily hydrolase (TIGR01549 family)
MTAAAYDALLLDHDGVVVTLAAKSALRTATVGAFADAGIAAPRSEDVDSLTISVSPAELRTVAARYDVDPDTLWRCREDRIDSTLRNATEAERKRPYDDVAALDGVGVPMGIVSNNQTRIIEYVLETYGLDSLVETIRARAPTRESLRKKKPEPTYLEAAAADLGCSNPLYVGDSESDIVAGNRAGFDTVFLRRRHNADAQLAAEPSAEAASLEAVAELVPSSN